MMDNIFKRIYDRVKGRFSLALWMVFIVLILIGLCAQIFLRPAVAQASKANKLKTASGQASGPQDSPQPVPPAQPAPPAQAAQLSAPAVNPITQAAVNAGVLSSTSRINQVAAYLTGNSQSGAYLFLPKIQPDRSIFSASLEIQNQNATPIYASASFAPLTSGQAGAVYDAVQYVAQSCDDTEKNIFKGLKRIGVIKKDIVMLDAGAVKIFLMPAGSGCVVIKKEVVQ